MTTITTGTQRPQKSLVVLIGLAITAVAVAATVAVSQPTATTKPADSEVNAAALIAEIIATEPAAPLAASDEQLVRRTTRVAPLPDSIADARDRAAAAAAIAQSEAIAEAVAGYVADSILGVSSVDAGIMAQAEALEEAVQNGGQPGVVATVKPPLIDGWYRQWLNSQSAPSASDQLLEGGRPGGR